MTAVLEVTGVTKRFGDFTAVRDADLVVRPGEVVGLLGANGAGKTTLVRMVLGLVAPSEGSIRLFGSAPTRQARRRAGYVPQGLGLYEDLTVTENLRIFELGFHVCADHWGKGIATEAARAVIAFAFDELQASALFAGHHPENVASRRTLERLGFRHTHDELYPPTGLQHPSYLLAR